MTKQRKIFLWFSLVLSMPAAYYAGASAVFYAWLNAAEPERWPSDKAALWTVTALVFALLFIVIFIFCAISLVRVANRQYREERNANPTTTSTTE